MIAAFFACLCVLIGAFAAQRRSPLLSIMWGCSVFAAVLCHTLMGTLLPITFAALMLGAHAERRPIPKHVIVVFAVTLIGLIIFFAFYLKPLLIGWNTGATWGYGMLHSSLASVYMVGWPVALLSTVGFLMLLHDRSTQNWYWMTTALGWALATVVFPLLVACHPAYLFPLSISIVVLAGCAIGRVYEELRSKSKLIGAAWIVLACLGNLPSLASHYMDGSRPDMRTAANYVEKHWQPGDRVTGFWIDVFSHYAEDSLPAISLPDSGDVDVLNKLADGKSRLWVVVQSSRSGLPEKVRRWLGAHCSYELKVRRTRFDYAEYCVEVFLYTPVNHRVLPP